MKRIIVNSKKHGIKTVLVDDEDYEELIKYTWHIQKSKITFYAIRWLPQSNKKRSSSQMHRMVMKLKDSKLRPDHIDRNGLNNQKSNLRVATQRQNCQNRTSARSSASKYLGVSIKHYKQKVQGWKYWVASIRVDNKLICLGQFPFTPEGEILAAKQYDIAAIKYFGEFANPNFK